MNIQNVCVRRAHHSQSSSVKSSEPAVMTQGHAYGSKGKEMQEQRGIRYRSKGCGAKTREGNDERCCNEGKCRSDFENPEVQYYHVYSMHQHRTPSFVLFTYFSICPFISHPIITECCTCHLVVSINIFRTFFE